MGEAWPWEGVVTGEVTHWRAWPRERCGLWGRVRGEAGLWEGVAGRGFPAVNPTAGRGSSTDQADVEWEGRRVRTLSVQV